MPIREQLKRLALPAIFRRLNPHWHQLAYLSKVLQSLRTDCVLDVGANAGQFALQLRSLGYTGLILSFEPDPQVFKELKQHSDGDARWHAFNLALGSGFIGDAGDAVQQRIDFFLRKEVLGHGSY